MSIGSVNGAGRVSSPTADPPTTPSPGVHQVGPVELDEATNQPLPPRFPWLSRLSAQLEPVALQKAPFTSAPLLGDNLNQAV